VIRAPRAASLALSGAAVGGGSQFFAMWVVGAEKP
jgi:hypothetical protein